jgi:hypothetical protein
MLLLFLMCRHVYPGDDISRDPKCKESRLGDLLLRVSEGNKELASIGSYTIALYRLDGDLPDFVTGLVRPRTGTVERVWITQLDKGKEPEIIVWTTCAGTGAIGKIDLFRFTDGKIVPLPLDSSKVINIDGYMGHDEFKMENGKLFRTFPLYKDSDPNSTPTGGTMKMVLDFKNMEWKPVKN